MRFMGRRRSERKRGGVGNSWGAFGQDQPQRTKKQKSKRRLRLILDIKLYFWAVFGLANNPSDLFPVSRDWRRFSARYDGRIYFTSSCDSLGVTAGHGEEKSVRYKDISSKVFNR